MFKTLSSTLQNAAKIFSKQAFINEENIQEGMKEVRRSLLEADVALPVVNDFVKAVSKRALGQEVVGKLKPYQAFIKIMQDEITDILGGGQQELNLRTRPPAVIMLVGLQGVGKTTSAAKLALWLKTHKKKNALLAGCDVTRPAAIEQLAVLGKQVGADTFDMPIAKDQTALSRAKNALKEAENKFYDVLIIDTAGRNNFDEDLMAEMQELHKYLKPIETLLTVDAMMGQGALSVAQSFDKKLDLTGLILTKVDSDARGGAALSAKYSTQKPIKFLGHGEKTDALEVFYPERIASRILGLGDIVSLAEQAERSIDHKSNLKLSKKLKAGGSFNLDDFRKQLDEMNKMGGLKSILTKLPLGGASIDNMSSIQGQKFKLFSIIIDSMTKKERKMPEVINPSRKQRIAKGSGMQVSHINSLLKQFKQMQKMMKKFNKPGGMKNMQRMMQQMQGANS